MTQAEDETAIQMYPLKQFWILLSHIHLNFLGLLVHTQQQSRK